jgi:multiple RNA-binding domain-containing protein 1
MAQKLDVSKADILDAEADNMAVRVALAETHIIQESIKYLEQEGVCIDAFKSNMKKERSDTVILIKNIPFASEEFELREMFGRHGDLLRVRFLRT